MEVLVRSMTYVLAIVVGRHVWNVRFTNLGLACYEVSIRKNPARIEDIHNVTYEPYLEMGTRVITSLRCKRPSWKD
jgi:hypothetical protein